MVGYEYWTNDNKPVRSKERPTHTPNAKQEEDGKVRIKEFWAVGVLDLNDGIIKTWQITQVTIKKAILNLYQDEDYGEPKNYDLKITRVGSRTETEYHVVPGPIKAISLTPAQKKEIDALNLEALFEGKYPSDTPKKNNTLEEDVEVIF